MPTRVVLALTPTTARVTSGEPGVRMMSELASVSSTTCSAAGTRPASRAYSVPPEMVAIIRSSDVPEARRPIQ